MVAIRVRPVRGRSAILHRGSVIDPVQECCLAAGGIAGTADLRRAGISDAAIARAIRSGRIVRLTRGRYAVAPPAGVVDRYAAARARHHRTALAVLAQSGPDVVLSHYSALIALGLPTYAADLDTVHLGVTGRGRRWRRAALVVHHLPDGLALRDRCVRPAVAAVQVGLAQGPRALLVAGDAVLRGGTDRTEIVAALECYRRTTGAVAVRAGLGLLDGRRESPGESVTAWMLHLLGVPVEVQPEVSCRGARYRPDFRVRGERVLIEFDGLGKYADPGEIRRERRREADLVADGWQIVRLQWPDLQDPARVRALIDSAVRRARRSTA